MAFSVLKVPLNPNQPSKVTEEGYRGALC